MIIIRSKLILFVKRIAKQLTIGIIYTIAHFVASYFGRLSKTRVVWGGIVK